MFRSHKCSTIVLLSLCRLFRAFLEECLKSLPTEPVAPDLLWALCVVMCVLGDTEDLEKEDG